MTDEDLRAIFAYLKTLAPAAHRVDNSKPPTACALCGQTHGAGGENVAPREAARGVERSRQAGRARPAEGGRES
jgi:hypothetical protein